MLKRMISALLALTGALVYGAADFFGGLAAKRLRSLVVTSVASLSGLAALIVVQPFIGGSWATGDIGWGLLAGGFGTLAIVLLYACLAIGPMSILSPITAVVSAIAPMLWGLLVDGESLSPVAYAGLGVALVAVVLVGFIPGEKVVRPRVRGLVMAVGAGAAIGGFLIAIDQSASGSGLVPLIVSRSTSFVLTALAVGVIALLAVRRGAGAASVLAPTDGLGGTPSGRADLEHALPTHPTPVPTLVRAWWLAVACGIVDASANVLMLLALRGGDLSIVSALTALYPAGTILLAAVVLRERVAAVQWAGLALALVAGGMLALG